MTATETLVSPRLLALQAELEAGHAETLAAFWEEVAQQGAPLIEPIAGDDAHALVTFVYRAPADTPEVCAASPLGGGGWASAPMTCLPASDVWHKTYRARPDVRVEYRLVLAGVEQPDPLNPRTQVFPADAESFFGHALITSVLELPAAPPQAWVSPRPGGPRGQIDQHQVRSALLDNERRVWVYTPAGYAPAGGPYPLVVLFDRWAYAQIMSAPTTLDNLIAAGALPPVVAVLVGSLNVETRNRELPCHPAFADFLADELLPWVRERYAVTADPAQTVVGGLSYGGLSAAYAGLRHPERFGKILSQSGSFWWKPADEREYEWLTRQFVVSPRLPLTFYLEAGLLETDRDAGDEPGLLLANRHLRDVLQAQGYPVQYSEYSGGHNFVCWQGSLAQGLQGLLGNTAQG